MLCSSDSSYSGNSCSSSLRTLHCLYMKIHKTFNKYSHKKITETSMLNLLVVGPKVRGPHATRQQRQQLSIDICGLCLTSAANWMAAAAAVNRWDRQKDGRPFNNIYHTLCGQHTHTHPRLMALFPGLPRWADTKKTNLDFTKARDSEWQWHQLGHVQVCTLLQTDNHASTHHSVLYRLDALPAAQPTASKHWRHNVDSIITKKYSGRD